MAKKAAKMTTPAAADENAPANGNGNGTLNAKLANITHRKRIEDGTAANQQDTNNV